MKVLEKFEDIYLAIYIILLVWHFVNSIVVLMVFYHYTLSILYLDFKSKSTSSFT